ncbi:MAG: hypothetical protein RI930_585 [Pseudomonadota bacterium]|jgi:hypothetical protein
MGGTNFGLNDSLKYFEFQLDSLDASGSNAEGAASTDWPLFLLGGKAPLSNIAAFKIIEAQIPFTYYVFNDVNTDNSSTNLARWTLTETGAGAGGPYYPKIAVGNVTGGSALATVLQTALNAVSSGYTVIYTTNTQKLRFQTTKANVTGFSFTFGTPTNAGNKNARLYIGFPGGVTSSIGTTLFSPNVILLSGANYVYVNSNALGNLTNMYLPQGAVNLGGGNSGPQMAKIPINCSSGEVAYWQDPDPQKWFDVENLNVLNQVDFYLTLGNTSGETPLKLNGVSFSLKLAVLVNTFSHNDLGGGLAHQDRVIKRIRPF